MRCGRCYETAPRELENAVNRSEEIASMERKGRIVRLLPRWLQQHAHSRAVDGICEIGAFPFIP